MVTLKVLKVTESVHQKVMLYKTSNKHKNVSEALTKLFEENEWSVV